MQTCKSDTVMIGQAYVKNQCILQCKAERLNAKTKQKNSDVTGNLWYKAKNVMHHLTDT